MTDDTVFKDTHITAIKQRTIIIETESARLLGGLVHSGIWIPMIQKLCFKHYTIADGRKWKPVSGDVLYNLVSYSSTAMQRLAYGRPYVEQWVDPIRIPFKNNASYLVIMSIGYITWGTYDSLTKQMSLRLADCEIQIPAEKLLAVNKVIDDAEDFMRGVPLAPYSTLELIKCDTEELVEAIPQRGSNRSKRAARGKGKRK